MADEIITLISKEYATGNFQSKLTEANEGDNIKITGEGDNLKISAEVPAQAKTTITTSDERVVVSETQTGYDLALNGSFIERGEYTELENTVGGHTTSITNLGNTVNTVKGDVDDLKPEVATLEQSVESNRQAITTLEQSVASKQDQLTSDNAGDNITITGEGSTLKINAAGGGEAKSDTWYCYCDNGELGFGFDQLKNDGILIHNWSGAYGLNQACGAKLVFSIEKSKAEVDYYLNAENTMAQDGTTITGYYKGCCLVCAICPWPANTPVPDTWYQNF